MNWKMSSRALLVATYLVLLSVLSVLLVSCDGGGGGGSGGGNSDPAIIAPSVSNTFPKASTTNIPVMTIVGVEFSEVVDTSTITPATFSVASSNGTVSGTIVTTGTISTFQPDIPFKYDTAYTATLSADVADLDGNHLEEYYWHFTTVATGPGDPSNYIPFEQGSTWEYQGTSTETGMAPINYINEIRINGTKIINGKPTTVFIESNFDNSGIPIEGYLIKDLNGVTNYGDNDLSDTITTQLTPYQEINFPATPGYGFIQTHKTGLDFGEDIDSDGVNETFNLLSTVTVVRLETVTVPAGTFVDCALVETDILIEVRVSSDNSLYKFHGLGSTWYAPDIGPVKTIEDMSDPDGNTYSVSEVLTDYFLSGISSTPVTFVQYRTFENSLNDRYHAFIDLRMDGEFIQASDVQSVALYDQNAVQIVPAVPPQFFTAAYTVARWNTTTSQFEAVSATGDSGYWFNLSNYSSITLGFYRFAVQPSQDLPFNYHVNFPAQTPLTPVASASMSSQWNPDGSLTLSWSEPPEIFDQYRVAFTDASGEGIFGGRVPTGVSQVTLSASLLEEIRLTGQLTLPTTINWRMQTRNYDGSTNYARSFSDPVTINWP